MLIRPTYAKVDIGAIKQNIQNIKKNIGEESCFCAVVKADGYGHGSVMVSKAAIEAGAQWLAVAMPQEAAELRNEGISAPILILGPSNLWQWQMAAELDLSMVAVSKECIKNAVAVAKEKDITIKIHLKVDTGMNRVGVTTFEQAAGILDMIEKEERLELEGLMTHFAASDDADKSYTQMQTKRFEKYIDEVKRRGFSPIIHAANSGATLAANPFAYDMVRVGISMYGCYPSQEIDRKVRLVPAMSLHTKISYIKNISAGDKVSYGCTFTADKPMRIATLPIGYADGFNRMLSNKGEVLIKGQRAKVIGRVCMDQTLVDISHIKDAELYDDVVCIGRQGGEEISAEEFAEQCSTINYEILCAISPRVPRLYFEE